MPMRCRHRSMILNLILNISAIPRSMILMERWSLVMTGTIIYGNPEQKNAHLQENKGTRASASETSHGQVV